MDVEFPQLLPSIADLAVDICFRLGAIVIFSPIFLIFGIILAVVGGWLVQVYMKAQLSVKREMSNAKAPVMSHFGAAMTGLVSIRAYGAQEAFKNESLARNDKYIKCGRLFYDLNRCVMSVAFLRSSSHISTVGLQSGSMLLAVFSLLGLPLILSMVDVVYHPVTPDIP